MSPKSKRKIDLEKLANARWGKLAAKLGLKPGWQTSTGWLWSFLYVEANARAIQEDLGRIPIGTVEHVLTRLIGAQMDVALRLVKDGTGTVGVECFLGNLRETVFGLLDSENQDNEHGNVGPAPDKPSPEAPPRLLPPNASLPASMGWGVSAYA